MKLNETYGSISEEYEDNSFFSTSESSSLEVNNKWWIVKQARGLLSTLGFNMWDSPRRNDHGATQKLAVLFWFVVLALAYAVERASFKILVDRAGPFRLLYSEAICGLHCLFVGFGLLCVLKLKGEKLELGLAISDLIIMAILDACHLILSMVSGSHVRPVTSVILVNLTIPLMACMSYVLGNSPMDWLGATMVTLAVLLALLPAIGFLIAPSFLGDAQMTTQSAWNTLVFTLSCVPAAISAMFKERTLIQYKQPVDPKVLNLLLSCFQLVFTGLVSPLFYSLQGIAMDGFPNVYPSDQLANNFVDACRCFANRPYNYLYPEPSQCKHIWILVLLHVLAIVTLAFAVEKIVRAGATALTYSAISLGIVLAVASMYLYELFFLNVVHGFFFNALLLLSTFFLLLGHELHHRLTWSNATFETVFPEPIEY